MNILTCFKVVPDLDQMPGSEWVIDNHLRIDTGFVKKMLNPYDESALELTLKYTDRAKDINRLPHLTALTIGGKQADTYLKTLYALRFNRAVRINSDIDLRFNAEAIASVIANFTKTCKKTDLVVTGIQSGVGDNAKTPFLIAEMLGWPCINRVANLEPAAGKKEKYLSVTSFAEGGTLKQTVKPPCVLAVGNAPGAYLRVPTLKEKVEYGKRQVEVLTIDEYVDQELLKQVLHDYQLNNLKTVTPQRTTTIIEGENPAEKAQKLYNLHLKERLKEK